ncbi:MAG TPA: Ku protein [Solirubrobacteraceae bacterium]|nr:Ku protein [Solirubrobacteraceae bacterium]
MARSIWSGAISFGLVNVPVKLYNAVQRKNVQFHQLHAEDRQRIQQKRVCSADGQEVAFEDLVKGYEFSPGQYVVVEPEELDAVAARKTRLIEVEQFIQLGEVDPLMFDSSYYVAPAVGAAKPFRLMVDAMREAGKVGIGRFVLRQKEHLVALRVQDDALVLVTLVYADEVVPAASLEDAGDGQAEVSERELAMARQLIEMLSAPFEPNRFHDEYREALLSLIERKVAGEEISIAPPPSEPAAVPDLMAALQASVNALEGQGGKATKRATPKAARAKAPARKPKAAQKS